LHISLPDLLAKGVEYVDHRPLRNLDADPHGYRF